MRPSGIHGFVSHCSITYPPYAHFSREKPYTFLFSVESECGTQYRAHQQLKKEEYCVDCDVKLTRRTEDANVTSVTKRLKIFSDNIDGVLQEILKRDDVYTLHLDNKHNPEEVYKAISNIIDRVMKENYYVSKD
ncbi:hypothetical protein [Candidatus Protochlamydia sp. R18]|uniref:hypothetical protein n=1 Tax=Candidatus Protochlamydia sp. R18 TaxID=1353977 RepID=UPI0005A8E8DA|nr:hypothetical protein [Candidatus Protochlamydia sp. R18]